MVGTVRVGINAISTGGQQRSWCLHLCLVSAGCLPTITKVSAVTGAAPAATTAVAEVKAAAKRAVQAITGICTYARKGVVVGVRERSGGVERWGNVGQDAMEARAQHGQLMRAGCNICAATGQ